MAEALEERASGLEDVMGSSVTRLWRYLCACLGALQLPRHRLQRCRDVHSPKQLVLRLKETSSLVTEECYRMEVSTWTSQMGHPPALHDAGANKLINQEVETQCWRRRRGEDVHCKRGCKFRWHVYF